MLLEPASQKQDLLSVAKLNTVIPLQPAVLQPSSVVQKHHKTFYHDMFLFHVRGENGKGRHVDSMHNREIKRTST